MKYRRLGRNGPQISAVSLGRGSQPIQFGEPLEAEFNATVRRALDLGINLFDSSDAYWGGRHETLLGRALKGRRNQALLATKFGNIDLPDGKKGTNGRPEYVVECCEASLRRFGVNVIDLLLPAPCRSQCPDRGNHRCNGPTDQSGQGAFSGHLRGRIKNAAACPP